jgi:hypothetical protein
MPQVIRDSVRSLAEGWCHFMHPDPMWPVNGRYRCPACNRTYPVPWANTGSSPAKNADTGASKNVVSLPRKTSGYWRISPAPLGRLRPGR